MQQRKSIKCYPCTRLAIATYNCFTLLLNLRKLQIEDVMLAALYSKPRYKLLHVMTACSWCCSLCQLWFQSKNQTPELTACHCMLYPVVNIRSYCDLQLGMSNCMTQHTLSSIINVFIKHFLIKNITWSAMLYIILKIICIAELHFHYRPTPCCTPSTVNMHAVL